MFALLRALLVTFAGLMLLTGVAYPAVVTALAQVCFPHQANGSLIERGGKLVGSELIGQHFDEPRFFWGRPSATAPVPYNGAASGGSNLGPTNGEHLKTLQTRIDLIRQAHPEQKGPVPVDLVTASASGLDPHISPAAAEYQVRRVAMARGLSVEQVRRLVGAHTESRTLAVLGEPRVNVLQLNLALDAIESRP